MAKIVINQRLAVNPQELVELCPFGAIEYANNYLQINAACRLCNICVNKGPKGLFTLQQEEQFAAGFDKNAWCGIAVYIEHFAGKVHPVSWEMLGKAFELAKSCNQKVLAVIAGSGLTDVADKAIAYGADVVYCYDNPQLEWFNVETYSAVVSDFIDKAKPNIFLFGGTTIGRALAPTLAANCRTGLTADCTTLAVNASGDLAQIRPAFGGNIMAHIETPNSRPQFATVRYKIFNAITADFVRQGKIEKMSVNEQMLESCIRIINLRDKVNVVGLEEAELIVVAGAACKNAQDVAMVAQLAKALKANLAGTRPLIEAGLIDPRLQIGLSGRTVKPKLIITCGVSGSVQFVAGMSKSDCIIAINIDDKAPIFSLSHYCLIGDIKEILPALLEKISEGKSYGE